MRQTSWYSDKISDTRTRTVVLAQEQQYSDKKIGTRKKQWYSDKISGTQIRTAVLGQEQ